MSTAMRLVKKVDMVQEAKRLLAEKRQAKEREQVVVAYIAGIAPVPDDLKVLVQRYREYAIVRGECVSYPVQEDERANRIYDALCVLA